MSRSTRLFHKPISARPTTPHPGRHPSSSAIRVQRLKLRHKFSAWVYTPHLWHWLHSTHLDRNLLQRYRQQICSMLLTNGAFVRLAMHHHETGSEEDERKRKWYNDHQNCLYTSIVQGILGIILSKDVKGNGCTKINP